MERTAEELAELGLRIRRVPCGEYASMNYVNFPVLAPNSERIILLPTYGNELDEHVRGIYEEEGFEVASVDLSRFFATDRHPSLLGASNCLTEVLV